MGCCVHIILKFTGNLNLKVYTLFMYGGVSFSLSEFLQYSCLLTGQPTQWQNMNLAGTEGVTQGRVGKSKVSVLVDHF